MMRKTGAQLAVIVAIGGVIAGCDLGAEQMTESAIESGSGEDVDVELNSEDGELSVESDEGSLQVGGDVPDEFDDVPLPDDFEFVSGATVDNDEHYYAATGRVSGDVESVWDEMVSLYEDNASDVTTEPDTRIIQGTVNDGELRVDIVLIGNPDENEGGTIVNVNIGSPE